MIWTIFPSVREQTEQKKQGIHISLRRFSDMCIPPVGATIFHLCMLFDWCFNPSCVTSCVRWYWRYFLQQDNKKTGDTHLSAPVQWYVYPSCERHIIPSLHVVWLLLDSEVMRVWGENLQRWSCWKNLVHSCPFNKTTVNSELKTFKITQNTTSEAKGQLFR